MKEKIIDKLQVLEPKLIDVKDVSFYHKGHNGWKEGGETHFELLISSDKFKGLLKLECHKLIYKILAEEMKSIHALAIKLVD